MNENTESDLTGLISLAKEVYELKARKIEAEKAVAEISAQLEEGKSRIILLLDAVGLESFKSPFGLLSVRNSTTCRMPVDPERKRRLFNYLREKDLFDFFATIHWKKLSSWWAEERKNEEAKGNFNFEVPGITNDEIVESKYLEIR